MASAAILDLLRADVVGVLHEYSICVERIVDQPSHTRCAVFQAIAENARYGVKLYPSNYSDHELDTELALVSHLRASRLPVPEYVVASSGRKAVHTPSGYKATVYEWIDGTLRETIDGQALELSARLMSSVHLASRDFSAVRPDAWLWTDAVSCLSQLAPTRSLDVWLHRMTDRGRPWEADCVWHLCHNDFSLRNLIWGSEQIGPSLIDFTNAIPGPCEWDIGVWCVDVYLRSAERWSITEIFRQTVDAYRRAGGRCTESLVYDLLKYTLAQRAIFMAFTASAEVRLAVWKAVDRARVDMG